MPGVLIVFVPVFLLLVWLIATYNRFVRLRQHLEESWSDIDVELKRRYELIPNLVATVKGYARHEREVLEDLAVLGAADRALAREPATGRLVTARVRSGRLQVGL